MTDDPRHAELMARCWQTQHSYDKARENVEQAVRFYDRVPDGDPRRTEAQRRLRHTMAAKQIAEQAASDAADALIAYENAHGTPTYEQPQLPDL